MENIPTYRIFNKTRFKLAGCVANKPLLDSLIEDIKRRRFYYRIVKVKGLYCVYVYR